jgi:hypothetical protein
MSAENTKSEYLLLFRGECWDKGLSPEQLQRVMNQVMAWFEGLKAQGRVKGGQALAPTGSCVSRRKGQPVADGPFAESKEGVGGYLLLEAESLEEAVAAAKSNPTLEYGITIEVRPVLEECPIFERARKQKLSAAMV